MIKYHSMHLRDQMKKPGSLAHTFAKVLLIQPYVTRLDGIHEAITAYMGGRLTLAPLESNPPEFILEMGYVQLHYHCMFEG